MSFHTEATHNLCLYSLIYIIFDKLTLHIVMKNFKCTFENIFYKTFSLFYLGLNKYQYLDVYEFKSLMKRDKYFTD